MSQGRQGEYSKSHIPRRKNGRFDKNSLVAIDRDSKTQKGNAAGESKIFSSPFHSKLKTFLRTMAASFLRAGSADLMDSKGEVLLPTSDFEMNSSFA
jgi:hypothetical protein